MFFTEETYRAVIVAVIQSQGPVENIDAVIRKTVGGLIDADRTIETNQAEITAYRQAQQERA